MHDNENYWIKRHESLEGSLASVGKIGTPEHENRQRYARKKRRVVDLLRRMGMLDLLGKTVLDVGCGVGIVSELFYALGAQVSGVDASPLAISEARDRAAPNAGDRQTFIIGSIVDFKLAEQFDMTFCLDVLYHVVDDFNWERAVLNLIQHTKPGGHIAIIEQLRDIRESPAQHVVFRTKEMYDRILKLSDLTEHTQSDDRGFLVYQRAGNEPLSE